MTTTTTHKQLSHTLNASERLSRLKIRLYSRRPFFSYILMNMNFTEVEDEDMRMAIDCMGDVVYSAPYVQSLTDSELEAVICHEAFHIIMLTFPRKKNRDHEKWNIATDICINYELGKDGFTLPNDVFLPDVKTAKMHLGKRVIDVTTAEQVYDKLMEMSEHIKQNADGSITVTNPDGSKQTFKPIDSHDHSDNEDGDGKDGEGKPKGRDFQGRWQEWKRKLVQGAEQAKARGDSGGSWGRYIDKILNPEVDWRTVLQRFIQTLLPFDYTMRRPHRMFYSTGVYMPSVLKKPTPILLAIDVSGSISQTELTTFASEINGILNAYTELECDLCYWSTEVDSKHIMKIRKENALEIISGTQFNSTGGTTMSCVADYFSHPDNKKQYACVVMLTDGYVEQNARVLSVPHLFVISKGGSAEAIKNLGIVTNLKNDGQDDI